MLDPQVPRADGPNPTADPTAPAPAPEPTPDAAAPSTSEPAIETEPPRPAWTKTYELPTARKVVSAGLQLAAESSGAVRRASIYIGLLTLGAFGPALVLLLAGIGRLLSDPDTAAALATDPYLLLVEQPEILEPLLYVYMLVALGLILLVAISIDAQAIAIGLLAGVAADRALTLREAIVRARQVFWRLAGAGSVVGIASAVVALIVTAPFLRPFDSNQGVTFIASIAGALVVTPFAFSATGIVLGDVGAMESLRRSVRLFQARPRIAFVVVLFTLVTSAIQTFAIGAGVDVAVRVAEFLNVGLDQGGFGLILTVILVLGFVIAFGSLTFTIAAIVAAPQVAAFLGLTFHSGGLDRARTAGAGSNGRWVSRPMLASMIGLAILGVLGLPRILG